MKFYYKMNSILLNLELIINIGILVFTLIYTVCIKHSSILLYIDYHNSI